MTEVKDIESQEVVEEAAAKGKESKKGDKKSVAVMKGVAIEEDGMRVAGVHINQLRMPLVGMFVSATVLLISVLSWKQAANPIRWREYAISVPAVTMSFSFLFILMTCKDHSTRRVANMPTLCSSYGTSLVHVCSHSSIHLRRRAMGVSYILKAW